MSPILGTFRNRRSVRKYINRSVSPEIIKELLEVATWAPSAHNAQPWFFLVLCEYTQKQTLAKAMAKSWSKDLRKDKVPKKVKLNMVKASVEKFVNTPVLILACLTMRDMKKFNDRKRNEYEHTLAVQSLSAAIENLLLAAHDKGLGSCWYCAPVFCKTAIQKSLKIPSDVEPQALISLGYPAETPAQPLRKSVGEIAFFGEWGTVS